MAQKATQKAEVNEEKKPDFQVEDLLKLISDLKKELEDVKNQKTPTNIVVQEPISNRYSDEVTIVNTQFGDIGYTFSTWSFKMSKYGQIHTISRHQFQELYNLKISWFEKGYLALDSKHMKYAEEIGCPVFNPDKQGVINPKDFSKFSNMNEMEIEKYYNGLSKGMKKSFASYFMSKCYDMDPDFYDVGKMNTMNHLTKGRLFDNLILACQSSISDKR